MKSFPLSNIFLPAILVSCTVFSSLTLPPILLEPRLLAVHRSPLFQGDLRPVFQYGNKNLAIRYLGFTIVLSAGSGILTAEFLRRRYLAQEKRQALTQQMTLLQPALELELASEFDPELQAKFDPGLEPEPESENGFTPNLDVTLEDLSILDLEPSALDWLSNLQNGSIPDNSEGGGIEKATEVFPDYLLRSPTLYEICRITVPHLTQRLCAIQFKGEFYRLVRTKPTPDHATDMANHLNSQGNKVVITEIDQGYAVWVWEPEAKLSLYH